MTDLDRLLELHKGVTWTQDLVDEYNSLKAKIEEKLDNHTLGKCPYKEKVKELEQQNKELKEVYESQSIIYNETYLELKRQEQKLEKIKEQARIYGFHDQKGYRLKITDEILDEDSK